MAGPENVYNMDTITPQNTDIERAGDAASFILSLASSSEPLEAALYPRAARAVVARLRKENKYSTWSMQDGSQGFMESRVGRPFVVLLLHSMEKGISDGNAWEVAGVSRWQ